MLGGHGCKRRFISGWALYSIIFRRKELIINSLYELLLASRLGYPCVEDVVKDWAYGRHEKPLKWGWLCADGLPSVFYFYIIHLLVRGSLCPLTERDMYWAP